MSANPVVEGWEKEGLPWKYLAPTPVTRPFIVPAGKAVQVPSEESTFVFPEGVISVFGAGFDHPSCGVKADWGPNFDTGEIYTVQNAMLAITPRDPHVQAMAPPESPYYIVRLVSSWKWTEALRLFVINMDALDHYCLGYGYVVAVLTRPRRVRALEE